MLNASSANCNCERVFVSSAKLQPVGGPERRIRIQNVALKIHFPVLKCLCKQGTKNVFNSTYKWYNTKVKQIQDTSQVMSISFLEKNWKQTLIEVDIELDISNRWWDDERPLLLSISKMKFKFRKVTLPHCPYDYHRNSSDLNENVEVPQGSVTRPLLFTLRVNDIEKDFEHNEFHQFADDTVTYTRGDNKVRSPMLQLRRITR